MNEKLNFFNKVDLPEPSRSSLSNLVAGILDDVDENIDVWRKLPGDPDAAYDLLALSAKIRRMKNGLITDPEDVKLVEELNAILKNSGEQIKIAAAMLPNPSSWLKTAENFLNIVMDPDKMSSEQAEFYAVELLDDLDTAELVETALIDSDLLPPEFTRDMDKCREWVGEHPYAFLHAAGYALVVAGSVREDILDYDLELASTLFKFEVVLEEAAAAKAFQECENVVPFPGFVLKGLKERMKRRAPEQDIKSRLKEKLKDLKQGIKEKVRIKPSIPDFVPVFAYGKTTQKDEGKKFEWNAEDVSWSVLTRLPPPTDAQDSFKVEFWIDGIDDAEALLIGGKKLNVQKSPPYFKAECRLDFLKDAWKNAELPALAVLRKNGEISIGYALD